MQRLRRLIFPLALAAALAVIVGVFVEDSAADLDNLVFTSQRDRIRLIVPRGWRASDQLSYPGRLLWMARGQPQGQMDLTAEEMTHTLYCSWPPACRTQDNLPGGYACALRTKLQALKLRVGPTQAGPKENEAVGAPSVLFEYDDGHHFLRQAIAVSPDRAYSLVLSAPNAEARATHTRAFDQALRTLQLLTAEEAATPAGIDAPAALPSDALPQDGGLVDGAILDGGAVFESAPAPKTDVTGPCPTTK